MHGWHRLALVLAAIVTALVVGACGGSDPSRGTVSVLYAGSLEALMNQRIGPAFERATGYTFNGYPAGSKDLANEIRGRVRVGDVFISAAPAVNQTLEGAAGGDWVSWYAPFATTRLVLGYNASSRYAHALRTQPWYRVIARPGFRLGFTDPRLDPKGVLTQVALKKTATIAHEPALNRIATDQSDLFPEQDLVGRLQAGQLDGGFFYTVEASAAHIPTVSISPIDAVATYTITILRRAPDSKGAVAFVKFLLSARGRSLLRAAGLASLTAHRVGSGVPSALDGTVRGPASPPASPMG